MIANSVSLYLMRYASLLAAYVWRRFCTARTAQHPVQLPAHPIREVREA